MCLHAHQVCDTLYHCPQKDDELLCSVQCPEACVCYGLSFVCTKHFPVSTYPDIRYIDASNSGMNVLDFLENKMLIFISLKR